MKCILISLPFLKFRYSFFFFRYHYQLFLPKKPHLNKVLTLVAKDCPAQLTEQEQAWLNQRHTVRVRISEFPPHMMTLPEPRGISVDYLKLVGKRFVIN